jgi:hypothetical protein
MNVYDNAVKNECIDKIKWCEDKRYFVMWPSIIE